VKLPQPIATHFLTDVLAAIFFRNYLANVVRGSWKVRSTKGRCVSGARHSWAELQR